MGGGSEKSLLRWTPAVAPSVVRRPLLLSMVLITAKGDITEGRADPVDPHKIALNTGTLEKPVLASAGEALTNTHTDISLAASSFVSHGAFLCVSTRLDLHSSL